MTFQPDRVRYKGRRNAHTLLSYKGSQIVFTAENGLLTVAITGQRFPAREILDYCGFNLNHPVEESVIERYGGGDSYIYRQAISPPLKRHAD